MSTMRMFYHPDRDSLDLASILHALSDPVRLRIVQSLAQSGELTCGAFGIDAPKSTLSHHFKVLREGGVIRTRMEGVHRVVSLRMEDLNARFPGLVQAILTVLAPKDADGDLKSDLG
ncbi:ArsR family transcriptional regulator [Acidithiobacillus ferrooxidans]|uniref:ArsR/SmtB family transcription factor n=1 Tax=Acidithiobacillus thiooxidans TaxID=930 RepID=UPI001CDD6E51|nr:helix-turn-helix transcriptional regulator [Acidithiobacillus thiooxidans]UBU63588.1 ArsR family transcriptional regulator [Acidithiobacillus ferrooxidans]